MALLFVTLGGAVGAASRYLASGWVQSWSGSFFPLGTLAVNVVGSLIIGFVWELTTDRFLVSPEWRLLLTTGFCGGLTTFSTFSHETLALLHDAQWAPAAGNVLLNVLLCLAATFLGLSAAKLL